MIALLLLACAADDPAADLTVTDRVPGDRTPLSASCDDSDPVRCHLPWPSNVYTLADSTSTTGLRLNIDVSELPVDDNARFLNIDNGFSRLTPLVVGFDDPIETGWVGEHGYTAVDAPIRLFLAQADHPDYGHEVPMWADIAQTEGLTEVAVNAYPMEVLEPGADYVAVVTSGIGAIAPERATELAMALVDPTSADEAAIVGYHAPTRTLLADVGIDPASVVRAWDFTTRTQDDVTRRLLSMIDQAEALEDDIEVEITYFTDDAAPEIAAVVRGVLSGVPSFLDENDVFVFDDDNLPMPTGTKDVEFRVIIPSEGFDGEEDYRIAFYGHGSGGDVTDTAFDEDIAGWGAAKVGFQIGAWNGEDMVYTLSRLSKFMYGTEQSTSQLMQSALDGRMILKSLGGALGDALADIDLAEGRRPDMTDPVWLGGSLGGTFGGVVGAAWPEVGAAVLNVPTGAWTHIIPDSFLYQSALSSVLLAAYESEVDVYLGIAMSQGAWDDMDGAAWSEASAASGTSYLLQESINDPIVPNQGTHMLAYALGADIVGPSLVPVEDMVEVDEVVEGAGLTQYKVPDTGTYDVHGFAARNTLAGDAAMEQITDFLLSYWQGQAIITFPEGCSDVTPDGTCDFSDMWTE